MQLNQDVVNEFEKQKLIIEDLSNQMFSILINDMVISDNLFFNFIFNDSDYQRFLLKFYSDDNFSKNTSDFIKETKYTYSVKKEDNLILEVKLGFENNNELTIEHKHNSIFNKLTRKRSIQIEEAISFTNKIIRNIHKETLPEIFSIIKQYDIVFRDFKKAYSAMKKERKTLKDYEHSLTFNKIMTLFSKDNNIANDIYEDVISAYYRDVTKQFITIKRDFDKIIFRKIEVEGKNNQKLSLMYGGQRISKAKLKEEIKDDLILFNGDYFKSTQEVIDKLGMKDLPLYNESNTMNGFSLQYDIDEFYNFFKKYIIANEF